MGSLLLKSNFIPCVFLSQQTHVPPLLRNVFVILICFSVGSFYSWSLLSLAPLSLPTGTCTPRRAGLGSSRQTLREEAGGKARSLARAAADLHPLFGFVAGPCAAHRRQITGESHNWPGCPSRSGAQRQLCSVAVAPHEQVRWGG